MHPDILSLDAAALTLQETEHFTLNASDDAEWDLISSIPRGIGRTRLGEEKRVFVLTSIHQMHCLRRIQLALLTRSTSDEDGRVEDDPLATPGHVSHCLNYLRQTILCDAAETLEKGDFMERDFFEGDRVGDTLVCRDWENAFGRFDRRYEEWREWRKSNLGL